MSKMYDNAGYGVVMFYTFSFLLVSNLVYFIYSVLS